MVSVYPPTGLGAVADNSEFSFIINFTGSRTPAFDGTSPKMCSALRREAHLCDSSVVHGICDEFASGSGAEHGFQKCIFNLHFHRIIFQIAENRNCASCLGGEHDFANAKTGLDAIWNGPLRSDASLAIVLATIRRDRDIPREGVGGSPRRDLERGNETPLPKEDGKTNGEGHLGIHILHT